LAGVVVALLVVISGVVVWFSFFSPQARVAHVEAALQDTVDAFRMLDMRAGRAIEDMRAYAERYEAEHGHPPRNRDEFLRAIGAASILQVKPSDVSESSLDYQSDRDLPQLLWGYFGMTKIKVGVWREEGVWAYYALFSSIQAEGVKFYTCRARGSGSVECYWSSL